MRGRTSINLKGTGTVRCRDMTRAAARSGRRAAASTESRAPSAAGTGAVTSGRGSMPAQAPAFPAPFRATRAASGRA